MKRTHLVTAAIVAIAASTAVAGNKQPTTSLTDLGMVFERARRVNAVERGETLTDLDQRVNQLIGDLDGNDKAAAEALRDYELAKRARAAAPSS